MSPRDLTEALEALTNDAKVAGALSNYLDAEPAYSGKKNRSELLNLRQKRDNSLSGESRPLVRLRKIVAEHDGAVDMAIRKFDSQALVGASRRPLEAEVRGLRPSLESRIRISAETSDNLHLSPRLSKRDGQRIIGMKYCIAEYIEDLTQQLSAGPAEASTRPRLAGLRQRRDIELRLLGMDGTKSVSAFLMNALVEYDGIVDALVVSAAVQEEKADPTYLSKAAALLGERWKQDEGKSGSWLMVWGVGAALGLATIVLAFYWLTQAEGPGWVWLAVGLAGLGAITAAFYTYSASSELSPLARWILVSLPALILVLALVLPTARTVDRMVQPVAGATIVILILGGLSTWVLRTRPDHRDRLIPSTFTSLEVLLASASGSGGLDGAEYRLLITSELRKLQFRIGRESQAQQSLSAKWATTFIVVGGAAALLSGAAGVTAGQEGSSGWVAILAISGAGLGALTTALNPGMRWEQARTLRLACESLEQEVGVMITLDLEAKNDARKKIEDIAIRFDALLGVPERPRLWDAPAGADPPG